jgi:hypothetical protein
MQHRPGCACDRRQSKNLELSHEASVTVPAYPPKRTFPQATVTAVGVQRLPASNQPTPLSVHGGSQTAVVSAAGRRPVRAQGRRVGGLIVRPRRGAHSTRRLTSERLAECQKFGEPAPRGGYGARLRRPRTARVLHCRGRRLSSGFGRPGGRRRLPRRSPASNAVRRSGIRKMSRSC